MAFVWVVIAVILQGRELELQREELKDTREVLNLQKDEMKRAADETREQTRIMTENLRAEAERQIYSEVEIILYSLALYVVSNYGRSTITIGNQSIVTIDPSKLYDTINKDNSDRVYPLVHNSLINVNSWIQQRHGQAFQISPGGGDFILYVHETLSRLIRDPKYAKNELAIARLKGLQIGESLVLLEGIKRAVLGGN